MIQIRSIYSLLSSAERFRALGVLILMIVGMIVETIGIGLVVPAFALLMQDDIGHAYPRLRPMLDWLGNPSRAELITGGMGLLVIVYFLKACFLGFLAWAQQKFNNGVILNLSCRIYALYLRQPYSFHLKRNSAQLIRNVVTEANQIMSTELNAIMHLLTEGFVLVGLVTLLILVQPVGALCVLVTLGVPGFLFQTLTHKRVTRWGQERQLHDGTVIQQVQQGLGGVKDVILLGRENSFLNGFHANNKARTKANMKLNVLLSMPRLGLEVLAVTALVVLIAVMIGQGKTTNEMIPILGLFGAAAFRILPSIGKILSALQTMRFGGSTLELLESELELETPTKRSGQQQKNEPTGDIEFKEIVFSYAGKSEPALKGLSFTIRKGEAVGFIGPSGSGKSSLVDVMLGLLTPESGQVLVGGESIAGNMRQWQDQIGYVPQAIFLTDDTLRRNIAFGVPEEQIDDSSVERAIKAAQLSGFIETLPMGLETVVGERGVRLSGGQRQRIGIARALYHDPSVLVLDEATSALDIVTESSVMDAINLLHGSKTLIIVAHRLSTVESCDRIYRLESGRIVKAGSPDAIL